MSHAAGVDARADIYALGVVLYHALAGRAPYDADSFPALVVRVLAGEPASLASIRSDLPEGLEAVVLRAMHRERDSRWESMDAFRQALLPFAEALSGPSTAIEPGGPTRRWLTLLLVCKPRAFEPTMERLKQLGANPEPLGGDILVVLGERTWRGDELERALTIAQACRQAAERFVISSGYALRHAGCLQGHVLDEVRRIACASTGLPAIVLTAAAAQGADEALRLEPLPDGLCTPSWLDATVASGREHGETRPLLGRQLEVAALDAAIETSLAQRAAVFVVASGAPGTGKTAMAQELLRRLTIARSPVEILVGRAEAESQDREHALLAAVLRARLGLVDATRAEWASALLALCGNGAEVLRTHVDALAAFLGPLDAAASEPCPDSSATATADRVRVASRSGRRARPRPCSAGNARQPI